jgi:hypothetical protein
MEDAPGDIESDQDDDKPGEERLVVLEGEEAQRDCRKNNCPNEKTMPALCCAVPREPVE